MNLPRTHSAACLTAPAALPAGGCFASGRRARGIFYNDGAGHSSTAIRAATARSASASHWRVVAQEAKQRARNCRSAHAAQSSMLLVSSSSFIRFPSAYLGGRPPAGPTKADSPVKGQADTGAHLSAFSSTAMGVAMQTMDRSFVATQWKPADTTGNDVVPQRDFGGVASVSLMLLEAHLVSRATFAGCLNECLRHVGRTDEEIAKEIHISKGYMSKLLRAVWTAQTKRLVAFCRATQCVAPVQKLADELGFELRPKKTELEMRLEAAEMEAAALRAQFATQSGRVAA